MKIQPTKKEIFLILILIAAIAGLLHSCSLEKRQAERLKRSVNNYGVEKSIAYLENNYKPYFKKKDTTIVVTHIITDTIIVSGGVPIDSIITLPIDGTGVFLENQNLKIEIENIKGKLKVIGKCKDRLVYKTDTITLKVPCPEIICPDIPKQTTIDKSWLSWFIGALGIIFCLTMLLIHLLIKK